MKTMSMAGTFFHATAFYYFSRSQLQSESDFYKVTWVLGTTVASLIELGAGQKEGPIFSIAHVSVEMIALGGLVVSVVGGFFSQEYRGLCLTASFVQMPYWALKFMAEVPHLNKRAVIRAPKIPSTLKEVTKEDVLYLNRADFLDDVINVICADIPNNNVILSGDPGCGKTTLVDYIGAQIKKGELEDLQGMRVFKTTAKDIIAGTRHVGDKEQRVKEMFDFLKGIEENSILFIDEIWQLIGAGRGENTVTDVAGHLLTEIEDEKVVVIGATTPGEERYLSWNPPFLDRFQLKKMPPMSKEERVQVLKAHIQRHNRGSVVIPDDFAEKIIGAEGGSLRKDIAALGIIASWMRRKGITAQEAAQKEGYNLA